MGWLRVLHKTINSVEHKQCCRCKCWFPAKDFGSDKRTWDGLYVTCKACISIKCKKYHLKNKEKRADYCKKNVEKIRIQRAAYREKNKEKISKATLLWQRNNPDKVRASQRKSAKRYLSTPKGHLSNNISRSIGKALKGNKAGRHWESFVSYTLDDLKKHLEKQFTEGMTWENYGEWHLDHKVPKSVFNFTKPEHRDFKRCWALKNLQPMWARENKIKSNKLEGHFQPSLRF